MTIQTMVGTPDPNLPTPQAVPLNVVCSECGLPWGGGHASLLDCVAALKAVAQSPWRPTITPWPRTIGVWYGNTTAGAITTNTFSVSGPTYGTTMPPSGTLNR